MAETPPHDPLEGFDQDPPRSEIGETHHVRLVADLRAGQVVGAIAWEAGDLVGGSRGLVLTVAGTMLDREQLHDRWASARSVTEALEGFHRSSRWDLVTPEHHKVDAPEPQAAARAAVRVAGLELHEDDTPDSTGDVG